MSNVGQNEISIGNKRTDFNTMKLQLKFRVLFLYLSQSEIINLSVSYNILPIRKNWPYCYKTIQYNFSTCTSIINDQNTVSN